MYVKHFESFPSIALLVLVSRMFILSECKRPILIEFQIIFGGAVMLGRIELQQNFVQQMAVVSLRSGAVCMHTIRVAVNHKTALSLGSGGCHRFIVYSTIALE